MALTIAATAVDAWALTAQNAVRSMQMNRGLVTPKKMIQVPTMN